MNIQYFCNQKTTPVNITLIKRKRGRDKVFSPYGVWLQDPWSRPPSPQTWSGNSLGSDASPCARDCPRKRCVPLLQLSPICLSKNEAQEHRAHPKPEELCLNVQPTVNRKSQPSWASAQNAPAPARPRKHTYGRNYIAEIRSTGL